MAHLFLSPSDLTFLWEDCPRCFYKKVRYRQQRPSVPLPKVFTIMDREQRAFFSGRRSESFAPALPPGTARTDDRWVKSRPLSIPGHSTSVVLRGRVDTILEFDDGTAGIVDFKTADAKDDFVPYYGRQLHAYAVALEQPAGREPPTQVSVLGLLCFEPSTMVTLRGGRLAYSTTPTWIEVVRDDEAFVAFLSDVLDVLEQPSAPQAAPSCDWCSYVQIAA